MFPPTPTIRFLLSHRPKCVGIKRTLCREKCIKDVKWIFQKRFFSLFLPCLPLVCCWGRSRVVNTTYFTELLLPPYCWPLETREIREMWPPFTTTHIWSCWVKFGIVEPFPVKAVDRKFLQETKYVERKSLSCVQKVDLCFKLDLWKAMCNELTTADIFKDFFRSQYSVQRNLLWTSESFRWQERCSSWCRKGKVVFKRIAMAYMHC